MSCGGRVGRATTPGFGTGGPARSGNGTGGGHVVWGQDDGGVLTMLVGQLC